jgi:hypothetical protein
MLLIAALLCPVQVELVLEIEDLLPSRIRSYWRTGYAVVYPKAEKNGHEKLEILDQVFERKAHQKPDRNDHADHHTEHGSSLQYLEFEVYNYVI